MTCYRLTIYRNLITFLNLTVTLPPADHECSLRRQFYGYNAGRTMALAAETQLGPYKIIALIGSGGMGEVYRARDTRLLRDVALKGLPAFFVNDPARLRRFEQEARAVAALNHQNIVSVYDVGNANGVHYIVSE